MAPAAWISSATFSDGTTLEFGKSDIVVLVGPNNAGKSATLRNLKRSFHDFHNGAVVKGINLQKEGTEDELLRWLDTNFHVNKVSMPTNPQYSGLMASIAQSQVKLHWQSNVALGALSSFFCYHLTADERLNAANPAPNIAITRDPLQHPIHYMQRYDDIEKKVSDYFRRAFRQDLMVHRNAGNQVPLYAGERPLRREGEDRVSISYLERLETLSLLHEQGDGMRSFVGVLLHTIVVNHSVVLLDEPEAFLHPPQARLLGQMLAREKQAKRQLFIATHSGDVLRGLLDTNYAVCYLKSSAE